MEGKKTNYTVFIDDVSKEIDLSLPERYLKFLCSHGYVLGQKEQTKIPDLLGIYERRVTNKLQGKFWFSFVISFQTDKNYFSSVFTELIKNRLTYFLADVHKENYSSANLKVVVDNSLMMMRFCQKSFKKTLKTWTYDFSMSCLKQMLSGILSFIQM